MKRQLLAIMLMLGSIAAIAQTNYQVSTDKQKKKVLLEEFTGQGCFWCTDGHAMASQMLTALDGDAWCVAIHTGALSGTYQGVNLQTDKGDQIGVHFNCEAAGYPSGMINRHDANGNGVYTLSRSLWLINAQEQAELDARVNLFQHAVYDGATRKLTVRVEGYYTDEPLTADQRLTVMVTQDGIIAYQNGGGNDYEHNHVLRATLTDALGDGIENVEKGQYFVKEYTYDVPEDQGHIDMEPGDFTVIAFVSNGAEEIENVVGGKPEYLNYGEQLNATLDAPTFAMGTKWGYNFFDVKLNNRSATAITSATFDVTVNGETQEQTIDCNIGAFDTEELRIPAALSYADKGKTQFSITLKQLNGLQVEETLYSGSFQKPKISNSIVNIQFMTDSRAIENHFYLKDSEGNVLQEFGPYADGEMATYQEQITVEDGKTYCIEITDSSGDGMTEGGKGGMIVKSSMGTLIDQFYQVSGWGVRSFFIVDNALGINQPESNLRDAANHCYSLDGKQLNSEPTHGIYIENGKKKLAKQDR